MSATSRLLVVLAGLALTVTAGACRESLHAPGPSTVRNDSGTPMGGRVGTGGAPGGGTGGIVGTGGAPPAVDAPGDTGGGTGGSGGNGADPDAATDVPVTCEPACSSAEVCVDGQCVSPCLPGQTNCPTGCADLMTDPISCGTCGTACAAGQFCSAGVCVMACKDGETRCDRSCVNLDSNTKNCGICGKACVGAESCVRRGCECVAPNQLCGGACTDVRNNRNHCGRCGNQCQGQLVCNGTSCGCPGGRRACPNNAEKCVGNLDECCPSGQSWCANVNRCVDLRSDKQHCGSCTTICPGADVCTNRKCICPSTLKDCGGGVCIAPGTCCPGKEEMCGMKCIPTADCCTDMECTATAGQLCNQTNNKCECPMGQEVCTRAGMGSKCIPTVGACCGNGDCTGGQVCGANNQCGCAAPTPKTCMTPTGPRCGACCPGEVGGCGANEECRPNLTCACAMGFRRCNNAGPCVQCCNNGQCNDPTKPICMMGTCAAAPPPPPPMPPPMPVPPGPTPAM